MSYTELVKAVRKALENGELELAHSYVIQLNILRAKGGWGE